MIPKDWPFYSGRPEFEVKKEGPRKWVALDPVTGIASQSNSKFGAISNLREAIKLFMDTSSEKEKTELFSARCRGEAITEGIEAVRALVLSRDRGERP